MKAFSENQNVRWLAAILAGLLGIGAVVMGAYMTLQVMKLVLPESLFAQYMALAFFDGGALGHRVSADSEYFQADSLAIAI